MINQDLVISTQGRSFWILDDLTPLHQIKKAKGSADATLYQPRPAFRTQRYGSPDLPSYPSGGKFHFYYPQQPDTSVKITFKVIGQDDLVFQTWSNKPKKGEKSLKLKQGLNKISWNLRYPGPKLVSDFVSMVLGNPARGPWAPTGMYTLMLTVGEKEFTSPFEIKKDPRWDFVSDEDLKAQFDLAIKLSGKIEDSHEMIKVMRSVKKQIKEKSELAIKAGHDTGLKKAANEFAKKLTALEDELIQNQIETSQDAINYPRKFSNHAGRLYGVLLGLDSKPTGGVLERFDEIEKEFSAFSKQYDTLMSEDLSAFNLLLEKEKVQPIINE